MDISHYIECRVVDGKLNDLGLKSMRYENIDFSYKKFIELSHEECSSNPKYSCIITRVAINTTDFAVALEIMKSIYNLK
jgi:hypothetical protein